MYLKKMDVYLKKLKINLSSIHKKLSSDFFLYKIAFSNKLTSIMLTADGGHINV